LFRSAAGAVPMALRRSIRRMMKVSNASSGAEMLMAAVGSARSSNEPCGRLGSCWRLGSGNSDAATDVLTSD
jgi:hypothetical protein